MASSGGGGGRPTHDRHEPPPFLEALVGEALDKLAAMRVTERRLREFPNDPNGHAQLAELQGHPVAAPGSKLFTKLRSAFS